MTTNILMNLVKTDLGASQKDYSSKYTSKDTSDSFMKVFEVANKSYNFNSEKMDAFSPDKWNEKSSNNDFSQKDYRYESDRQEKGWERQEDRVFSEEPLSCLQEQKPVEEPVNKTSENKQGTAAEPVKQGTSEPVQEKAEIKQEEGQKTVKAEDTSSHAKEAAPAEGTRKDIKNTDVENKVAEKSGQTQGKAELANDTAGKLLLEKEAAKTSLNTGEKAEVKAGQQATVEKQVVKELPQKTAEKQVENPQQKTAEKLPEIAKKEVVTQQQQQKTAEKQPETTKKEVITQQQQQKNAETLQEDKKTPETKIPETKVKVAEKASDDKIDFNQQAENSKKKTKTTNENSTSFAKHLEIKEELKVENIKITVEAEAQKALKTPMDMNKQNQQNFGQQVKANAMHSGLGEGGVHKLDIQKAAEFSKVMSSKQTQTTQNSVINQVKEASAKLASGKSEVTITLRPESFGKVNINIVSNKGEVTAQITAENNQTKEMLLKGAESLRQSLVDQGINANKITVNVQNASDNETDFEQASQDANSSETHSGSKGQENLAENDSAPAEFESYDFEEEENEENMNLTGKVDYKV